MGSAHTLPTILSKSGWPQWCRDGVQSKSSFNCTNRVLIAVPRCDAPPYDLDGTRALRRTHEKTDFLITCFDPGTLWDDFGVRSDVVVSLNLFLSVLHLDSHDKLDDH